jgi:AcrR family transcriptional regulator
MRPSRSLDREPPIAADSASTYGRIIAISASLFARWGYHGTSTRRIAAEVGIQQPSLFHHFPSKKAIMEELLSLNYLRPQSMLDWLLAQDASPDTRLFAFIVADLQYARSLGINLSSASRDDVLSDPDFAKWRRTADEFHDSVAELFRQGMRANCYVPMTADLARIAHTGITREIIRLIGSDEIAPSDDWCEEAASFVLRSVLTSRQRLPQIRKEARPIIAGLASIGLAGLLGSTAHRPPQVGWQAQVLG